MALEKILQKTVAEKEELEQKVKDAEDERESLKNKVGKHSRSIKINKSIWNR